MRTRLIHALTAALLLALPAALSAQSDVTQVRPNIYLVDQSDPFTDEQRIGVIVHEPAAESTTLDRGSLMVRCDAGDLDVFVTGSYFGSEERPVLWRLDDGEVHRETWGISTDGTGVFAPVGSAEAIARGAISARELAVRVTDYDGSQHTYLFDLTGYTAALDRGVDCVR